VVKLNLYEENGRYVVVFDHKPPVNNPEGPLQYTVSKHITQITQILGELNEEVSQDKKGAEERRKGLISLGKQLYPDSKRDSSNLLDSLLEAVRDSLGLWEDKFGEKPDLMNPDAPFPVHLHLRCKPDMLKAHIDLILDEALSKGHICALMPVTWRIETERWKHYGNEWNEQHCNQTKYDNFSVVYSCHTKSKCREDEIPPIDRVSEKARTILDLVGQENDHPVHAKSIYELREAVIKNYASHMAHVISHGLHNDPADLTYIFVADDYGNATPVTANNLSPDDDEKGLNFAFFNCCDLGSQAPENASYCGGFAEEAIKTGLCYEIIANRWGATQCWAHELELAFYETKPRTAQTRAVALLRARLKVLKKMKKQIAEKQYNPTWLAPIHIWADSKLP
jgi:hypothetical protein